MMAELAAANDLDLYSEDGQALVRLVRRALPGIEDPSLFARQAGAEQEPVTLDAGAVAWAAPYAERFQDAEVARMVARSPSLAFLYIGGRPPSGPSLPASKPWP